MSAGIDPFVAGDTESSYFITTTLRQRIELVRHLVGFGRQIVVLTGPAGAGKTALLDQITGSEENDWHVVQLTGGPTLNGDALLERICGELGIERDGGDISTVKAVQAHVATANAQGRTTVLAIDDADGLPADTAGCLAALAHATDAEAELKVVLSADPALSAIIDQLQHETGQDALLHVVEVPRLSDEQTREMLQHRWASAYGDERFPFSEMEMSQIYQQAAGLPGKAIVLARQVQIMSGGPASTERDPAQRLLISGVAAIGILVVIAFFSSGSPDEDAPELVELDLPGELIDKPENEAPPVERPAPSSPTAGVQPPAAISAAPAEPPTALEPVVLPEPAGIAETAEPAVETTVEVHTGPTEPAASGDLTAAETAVPAPSPPGNRRSPPAAAAAENSVTAVNPPPPAESRPVPEIGTSAEKESQPAYSLDWLRTRPESSYVLQLFGVRDRAAAQAFIRKRGIGPRSTIITTRHADAPWYVVIYGHYRDRAAAQATIDDLPAKLAGTSPWARPIKSLE